MGGSIVTRDEQDANSRLEGPTFRPPASSWREMIVWRLLLALLLGGLAALSIGMGKQAIQSRSFDYAWESGQSFAPDQHSLSVTTGTVHLRGSEAIEQGVGLLATGVTFALWAILLLTSMAGRQAPEPRWRHIHSAAALFSLIGLSTAALGFFPPWHIPRRPSCDAFYAVLLVFLALTCVGDRQRSRHLRQRVLPAVIVAGVLAAQFWVGALAGTVAGIFLGLTLGLHLVMLIPSLRKKARIVSS
jgi:hypothetical protein